MEIVRTGPYKKALKKLNASDSDIAALEQSIANDPFIGKVIPGLEGLRKVRFRMPGKGKRGGGRAIYYLLLQNEQVLMILAYSKVDQEDLTPQQKKAAKALIEEIGHE